ncbi:MAG TPA: DNA primase [Acidobacteriota bacterium]
MAYPRSFIDDIRRNVDPLQVIGEAVALKRRGSRWLGLCPFHDEKTPSFSVDAEQGLWHCFGCGEGGDLFAFVMQHEALGFHEAVRSLAERAGLPLPAEQPRAERAEGGAPPDRQRLLQALAAADGFYREQLQADAGAPARDFLAARGFDPDTVAAFGLGFAPDAWEAALQRLVKLRFSVPELEAAGLVKRRETGSGSYDRLRRRVVFPIRDLRGQTIAFGGRVIDSGEPKYLNSPETPTFHKSRTLYGIFEGRESIAANGFALLVEGYFDLLACAQYGFRNVVAPLGTSFTQDHAKLLARFTRKAVISFDGDAAGQTAAERTAGVFLSQGFQVNVVRLPERHDPDSFLREAGKEGYREALKRSESGLEFLVRRAGERTDLGTPRGKAEALSSLLEFVVSIDDRVERAEWLARLSERLQIAPRLVEEAAAEAGARARRFRASGTSAAPRPPGGGWKADLEQVPLAERDLLRAVLEHPEWRQPLEDLCGRDAIRDGRVRALLAAVEACEAEGVAAEVGNLLARCEMSGAGALMARLRVEEKAPLDWDAARNCALGIHDDSLRRRLREMSKDIREALEAGDKERFGELNREKVSLAQRIGSA